MITSVVAMKAILLAGGKGTRLRPLTIHTPKPIVPIFDRPFLHYQLDLLKQVPEIDEVILSLNYQPRRIEEMFGDGTAAGIGLRYVVEPAPCGTPANRSTNRSSCSTATSSPTSIWRPSSRCTASARPRPPSCSHRSR